LYTSSADPVRGVEGSVTDERERIRRLTERVAGAG
jgi:hypothetical protein